jgi:hypothetical protein
MTRTLIDGDALEVKIAQLLDTFFKKRQEGLGKLKLEKKLKDKNPYLFRAIGVADANEIITALLDAHISSSDETIFGNDFFEPLAKWVAENAYRDQPNTTVQVSGAEGCDIAISHEGSHEAIAVKSGPKIFNSQSRKKQVDEFKKIQRIITKEKKLFLPLVGYCYGSKTQRDTGKAADFQEYAGQKFWMHLTGEPEFYLRIMNLMKAKPQEYRQEFQNEYNKAKNKFSKEFLDRFSNPDGSIDWETLTKLNCAEKPLKFRISV